MLRRGRLHGQPAALRADAVGRRDEQPAVDERLDQCVIRRQTGDAVGQPPFAEQVRRQGYAVEDGEYKIGLRSVSAPVYGVDGAVRCTVGIVGMLRSTHSEEFRRAVEQVTAAGRMLSAALGYTGE